MPEIPEKSKSFSGGGRSDLKPNKPTRQTSSSARLASMKSANRRRPPGPPSIDEMASPGGSVNEGGSSHTRTSLRSTRSSGSVRPPSGRSPGRGDIKRSLSGSEHSTSRRPGSDHGREARRMASSSEHHRTLSSSEHRRTASEASDSSSRRTRTTEEESLLKARERLQGRTRAAPSPQVNRPNMSEILAGKLKQNVPGQTLEVPLETSTRSSRPERTLSKAARTEKRRSTSERRRTTRSRSDGSVASNDDDDGASIVSSRSMRRGRGSSGSSGELAVDDDEKSTASKSRSRRGSRGRRPGGGGRQRSRSRSKSAKRRPVRKPTIPVVEVPAVVVDDKAKEAPAPSATVVSSTSVKVRRKPASSRGGLGAGLAFLDDLAPKSKKGSRETRSVGADMMYSPQKSTREPKRRMARAKSSEGGGLMAGLSMLDAMNPRKKVSSGSRSVGPEMMTAPPKRDAPVRRMVRTRSQDAAGISDLAAFLQNSSKGKKKVKGSSRSVGGIPMSSDQPLKPSRRRLKKSGGSTDDESEDENSRRAPGRSRSASFSSGLDLIGGLLTAAPKKGKKMNKRHSSSFGSGLDLYTASSDDEDSSVRMRGRKPKKRLSSSSGSGLDLQASSLDDDVLTKKGLKSNLKYSGSLSSGLDLYSASSDGEEPSVRMKGRKPTRPADELAEGSLHISDLISAMGAEKKKSAPQKRRSRDHRKSVPKEKVDENQQDIFSYYTWSTSRQNRTKFLLQRKKLVGTVRQGALMSVYESFVKM